MNTSSDHVDHAYLSLLHYVLKHGQVTDNRTDTQARSVFGGSIRIPVSWNRFPLLTTKFVSFKSVYTELLWFLRGYTDVRYLQHNKCTIWNEWAVDSPDLGPIYGHQWRSFGSGSTHPYTGPLAPSMRDSEDMSWSDGLEFVEAIRTRQGVDQIKSLISTLMADPNSRRAVVSAWNPTDIPDMALAPCHTLFQCRKYGNTLNMKMYQRSADIFLGVPYNIASYALLLLLLSLVTDSEPGHLELSFGDLHLYENHVEQACIQLARTPKALPKVEAADIIRDKHYLCPPEPDLPFFTNLRLDDLRVSEYTYHPAIRAKVAV